MSLIKIFFQLRIKSFFAKPHWANYNKKYEKDLNFKLLRVFVNRFLVRPMGGRTGNCCTLRFTRLLAIVQVELHRPFMGVKICGNDLKSW